MSSYILLTLDLTPPQIEILAPDYTTLHTLNEIRIVGNEKLSPYQDIYIVDSDGNRHDYTFLHQENEFVGYLSFNNFPLGISTIYAQVKDKVDNFSDLISKEINIFKSEKLDLEINDHSMKCLINSSHYDALLNSTSMNMKINENTYDVLMSDTSMDIEINTR